MENRKSALVFFILFLVLTPISATAEVPGKITIEAGGHSRIDTPVCVSLGDLGDCLSDSNLQLVEVKDSQRLPVTSQLEPGGSPRLWWILSGTTPAGDKRIYELVKDSSVDKSASGSCLERINTARTQGAESAVEVQKNDSFSQIRIGQNNVLQYNSTPVPPPAGADVNYTRGAFIHPLWSPSGAVLTEIHSPGHIHHMGIWMPWTKTKYKDREINFWDLKDGGGTVRFVKFISTASGPVYGGFQVQHEHVALKAGRVEDVVLNEIWDVRVYNTGGQEKGYWLWDFVSTQHCATDSPLHLYEYRYGGLGFRATGEWKQGNCDYLTSEGRTRIDGHATRARWCDMFGVTGKDWAGVTIMSHPANFRHPEPMRIWPEGNIFFNFAPSLLGDWEMEPGRDYVFRYRFYVHQGKVIVADAERLWDDFAEPPKVKLEKMLEAAVKNN